MKRAEGMMHYPATAEGFGRRLDDVRHVRWVVPVEEAEPPERPPVVAKLGAWQFPAGIYELSIQPQDGEPDERRVLLGDRRRRRREVDAHSLEFEERGSGERRKLPDDPGWH